MTAIAPIVSADELGAYPHAVLADVRWYLDGKFIVAYDDADPVKGHQFGWNNWATDVRFDDLRIFAL